MSEHQRRGNCVSSGKRCYPTRAEAKKNLRRSHLQDVSVYKCYDCGYFHQGGWHGVKYRALHRGETDQCTMTIIHASQALTVSPEFIRRLIESGKVRSENGLPYRADIEKLLTN